MTTLLLILLTPLLAINLVFVAEVLAGLARAATTTNLAVDVEATIIVPAHDEAECIAQTLEGLKRSAGTKFAILVVADNCGDDTAAIARQVGVEVVERHDPTRRGKGFALAFAREWLRERPPSAVIVLDADCHADSTSLGNLAAACLQTHHACQAINLLEPSRSASPMVQISSFAFLIKNLVRQRGLQRLAGGVHLTGTGMCLPWDQFNAADLATSNIVEDIRLGIELSRMGAPPQLAPDSFVWSPHADLGSALSQRSRWEGGFLAMARATAPGLIASGLTTLNLRTLMSGLDLLVPPLAMLAMVDGAALLMVAVMALASWSSWTPALMTLGVGLLVSASLLIAWWREGRDYLPFKSLLKLPLYALWKVPMYVGLLTKGAPSEWVRTERPTGTDREA